MTVVVDSLRYERTARLLWRDTGQHVLVLPPDATSQVLVLGGGGAAVWRLLDRTRSLRELIDHFDQHGGSGPDLTTLLDCLSELVDHRLLRAVGEHDDDRG